MPNPGQMADFFSKSGLNPNDPHWQEMFRKTKRAPDPVLVRNVLSFLFSGNAVTFGEELPNDERAVKMLEFYMEANQESFKKLAE